MKSWSSVEFRLDHPDRGCPIYRQAASVGAYSLWKAHTFLSLISSTDQKRQEN